jgi:hypothetical protein
MYPQHEFDVADKNPLLLKSYPQHEVSVADIIPRKVKISGYLDDGEKS